ncbi:MAG: hypothetical protein Q7R80_00340 [bacterium]|nr:hypothetical protein [bacterium]
MAKRSRSPRSPYQRLALGFLGVVVLLAVAVLLLSVARVDVTITPRAEQIVADFDVTIIGSGTPTGREVLGRLVRVEGTGTAERVLTAGVAPSPVVESAPAARAEGSVTLVNTMTAPQPLVATTRLLSADGVLFRMKSGATIPANGKLENVRVYADLVGEQGNIGPTKFSIPGLSKWLQARVWAESSAAMSGGRGVAPAGAPTPRPAARSLPVVREADLAEVQQGAGTAAKTDARARADALAEAGEEVVPIDETARVTPRGAVGEARDRVSASAVVTMTAILIPKGALEERARQALSAVAASSGRELRHVRTNQLRTRLVSQDPAAARATIAVHVEGDAVLKRGSLSFEPRRISGFTAPEVQTYLRSIPGVQDVEVQLWPFWVKRVPASAGSVKVEVREMLNSE